MPVEHVHSKLANAYHSLGDVASAEAEIRKEIQLAPRMASPHAILAGLLAEQGRTDDARREFETALSLTKDEQLRALFQRTARLRSSRKRNGATRFRAAPPCVQ